MSAASWGAVAAVMSALVAVAGTMWANRRSSPAAMSVVFAAAEEVRADRSEDAAWYRAEVVDLRAALAAERADRLAGEQRCAAELAEMRAALAEAIARERDLRAEVFELRDQLQRGGR